MSDSPIVVVGAGYVGHRFVQRLGDTKTIELGRSSSPDLRLDLDNDQTLPITLPASYCVLYTVPPAADSDQDIRLKNLLGMLQQAPQRFTYISTTGVYGDHQGASVSEQSALLAASDRAKRRLSAESILLAWAEKFDIALSILRVPGIYGPGRLGIERIKNRDPLICESDAHPGNRIHVDDLVTCCDAALRGDTPATIYNVADGDHRSPTWFSTEVARQIGLALPPEVSREDAGKNAAEARVVDVTRMREQLGVIPKYANAEDGIRASLVESGLATDAS